MLRLLRSLETALRPTGLPHPLRSAERPLWARDGTAATYAG